jgi:zinc protease
VRRIGLRLRPRRRTAVEPAPWRLPGEAAVETLDDGLTICVLSNRAAPVVTTALWYRASTRDEPEGQGGIAHFLEHMMFKGSAAYGAGEIDRRTQALGGDNNAFTSHDATVYHFSFAPPHWREALTIEADRMASLALERREVDAERRVILEEIAMYEAEPWDSLDQRVQAARFPGHAYGRPVLGTAAELAATGRRELAEFHRRFYRPSNAVLVVAGDVGPEAAEAVREHFAGVARRDGGGDAGAAARAVAEPTLPAAPGRIVQRKGEVPRLLAALPAAAVGHPDHAPLRIATVVLGSGRASRLHRRLVDEEQLCQWVNADLAEAVEPGSFSVAAELVPGVEPARVEALVLAELEGLALRPPDAEELERARRVTLADWVMGHEKVYQQALAAGFALALFGDLEQPERSLARCLEVEAEGVAEAARRYLDPCGAVIGWSLPRNGGGGRGEEE